MTKYQVIGTIGFLAGIVAAFVLVTGSAAAQVRGVAAVPATGLAPALREEPENQPGVPDRQGNPYRSANEQDPDMDRRLAGGSPVRGDDRSQGWQQDRDYGVRGSDGRYYDPAGDAGYNDSNRYDRGYDGRDDRYSDYTDEARAYTDRYRPQDRHGYDSRGYYDRSYNRDYRRRYPQSRVGSVYLGGGSYGTSFGISFDLGDVTLGYRDGYRDNLYVYHDGYNRYRHRDWRRGYTGRYGCHPVSYRQVRYGRAYRVTSTMCYDRYGYGYVVPGKRGYW